VAESIDISVIIRHFYLLAVLLDEIN